MTTLTDIIQSCSSSIPMQYHKKNRTKPKLFVTVWFSENEKTVSSGTDKRSYKI